MVKYWRFILVIWLLAPLPGYSDWDLGVTGQITSDWRYHGVSENRERPALGINFDVQHKNLPWFAGVEAHRARASSDSERHESLSLYLGADYQFATDWLTGVTVKAFRFPDAERDWDYIEFGFQAHHPNGLSLQIDYADNYYHRDTSAWFANLNYTGAISDNLYWQAGVRKASFSDGRWPDYFNPSLLLGLSQGLINVNLRYDYNNRAGEELFIDALESSSWSLSVLYQIR